MENDGLVEVTLSKPWLESAAEEVVRVDPLRAEWLNDNGYGSGSGSGLGQVKAVAVTPPAAVPAATPVVVPAVTPVLPPIVPPVTSSLTDETKPPSVLDELPLKGNT